MPTRMLIVLTLGLGGLILFAGAWTGSPATPPQNTEAAFVPQDLSLDAHIIGSGVDAAQLLQKALAKLEPANVGWLKTRIRQTMTDARASFVVEGCLQLGPNHCARLEMDLANGPRKGRLLVISDGMILAQVREAPGAKPAVDVEKLPADGVEVEKYLGTKSCGGPGTLLKQLGEHLAGARLQTGLLGDTPVIQVKGDVNPDAIKIGTAMPIRHACVYLNAHTLWLERLEWFGGDQGQAPQRLLRIEFLEPELNRALSVDECMRAFSYEPPEFDS